jgi:hypothetical protein
MEPAQVTMEPELSKHPIGSELSRRTARGWTAAEKFRLRGLAKQGYSAEKIARLLRRPVDTTVTMAARLGHSLD